MSDAKQAQLAAAAGNARTVAGLQASLQQANARLTSAGLPPVANVAAGASVTVAGSTDTILGIPVAVVGIGVAALGVLIVGAVVLMRRKG